MKIIQMAVLSALLLGTVQAEEVKPYDWSQVLQIPPGAGQHEGLQIFHFKSTNKRYTNDPEAKSFVEKYLKKAKRLKSDAGVLKYASQKVTLAKGVYLEMGVCTGKTINFIAGLNPHQVIYGFDSFEGLPEDWVRKDKTFAKGTFAFKEGTTIPPVLHNVRLTKGLFKDVLPTFKDSLNGMPIAFLHIDCDIYSSTKDILDTLGNNIIPGTIIVFDELYNYPGFENHEWKALQEFLKKKNLGIEFLAFNVNHEQVAVKILKG